MPWTSVDPRAREFRCREDFESIMETLDVLADATAMQDVEQSKADSAADRYVTSAEMEKIMAAGHKGSIPGMTRTW
jgi:hypothetical protein